MVPVCNRFASLDDECATPAVLSASSNEETEERSQGGLVHSSDVLEISAEMMMPHSLSQEFQFATSRSQFKKQQERNHGENRLAVKLTLFLSHVMLRIVNPPQSKGFSTVSGTTTESAIYIHRIHIQQVPLTIKLRASTSV